MQESRAGLIGGVDRGNRGACPASVAGLIGFTVLEHPVDLLLHADPSGAGGEVRCGACKPRAAVARVLACALRVAFMQPTRFECAGNVERGRSQSHSAHAAAISSSEESWCCGCGSREMKADIHVRQRRAPRPDSAFRLNE